MKLINELRTFESDYTDGSIEITGGLTFSQYQTLRTIDFYTNSKYLNGNKDGLGREIPFFNIVNTMVDTAVVATDIDTKDIVVEADDEASYVKSFLFNHEIQNWMKEANFAKTLNEMGETRARYGGVVIKKRIEDYGDEKGVLKIEVVDWKNLVTDPVDFENGIKIEKHYLTPYEVRQKKDIWENTEDAINLYAQKGYTKVSERLEVWEVEGMFPVDYLDDDAECSDGDVDYSLQRHFFCVKGKKTTHLYWEEIKDSQYKYLPWKVVAGRALGRGVVEEGDEAQVWTNDAAQKEQMAMELAGKIVLKTNSKKIGNNVNTEHDNGSIMVLEDNKDVNVLNLLPAGVIPEFQALQQKWWSQYERATSSYDAVRGETPPSGQPYRLQALVAQSGSSHFDYRREEWGIFLKEMFYDWVLPYIQKKLSKAHILGSDFTPEELSKIDEAFSVHYANQYVINQVLNGNVATLEDYVGARQRATDELNKTGRRRFMDVPDGYYKDMKSHISINITGEQKNKMAIMETLSTTLQTMAQLVPMGIISPEDIQGVFNKILEMSGAGISPISLNKGGMQAQQGMVQGQPPPQQPQQQQLGGAELQALRPQGAQ